MHMPNDGPFQSSGIWITDDGSLEGVYIDWIKNLSDDTNSAGVFVLGGLPTRNPGSEHSYPGITSMFTSHDFVAICDKPIIDKIWEFGIGLTPKKSFLNCATLVIQELAISKAIRRHIKKSDRSKNEEMVSEEIQDLFSTIEDDPIAIMKDIEIDGHEVTLSILEFSESSKIEDEKNLHFDEMLLHIIMFNDFQQNNKIIKNIRNFRNKFRWYSQNIKTIGVYTSIQHNAYIESLSKVFNSHFLISAGAASAGAAIVNKLKEIDGNAVKRLELSRLNINTGTPSSNPYGAAQEVQIQDYSDQLPPGFELPEAVPELPLEAACQDTNFADTILKTMLKDNIEMILFAALMTGTGTDRDKQLQKAFTETAMLYTKDWKLTVNNLNIGGETLPARPEGEFDANDPLRKAYDEYVSTMEDAFTGTDLAKLGYSANFEQEIPEFIRKIWGYPAGRQSGLLASQLSGIKPYELRDFGGGRAGASYMAAPSELKEGFLKKTFYRYCNKYVLANRTNTFKLR